MPNIHQTDASITHDEITNKALVKITKLSGMISESKIRLYITELLTFDSININFRPYIDIEIYACASYNHVNITSIKDISPLYKGDKVVFHLENGDSIVIDLIIGRLLNGKEARSFTYFEDIQFLQFQESYVSHVEIFNSKALITRKYIFAREGNSQYSNQKEGKELFKIMVSNIISGKRLLLKNMLK